MPMLGCFPHASDMSVSAKTRKMITLISAHSQYRELKGDMFCKQTERGRERERERDTYTTHQVESMQYGETQWSKSLKPTSSMFLSFAKSSYGTAGGKASARASAAAPFTCCSTSTRDSAAAADLDFFFFLLFSSFSADFLDFYKINMKRIVQFQAKEKKLYITEYYTTGGDDQVDVLQVTLMLKMESKLHTIRRAYSFATKTHSCRKLHIPFSSPARGMVLLLLLLLEQQRLEEQLLQPEDQKETKSQLVSERRAKTHRHCYVVKL